MNRCTDACDARPSTDEPWQAVLDGPASTLDQGVVCETPKGSKS